MNRMKTAAALLVLALSASAASGQEKAELRYAFQKGEKFPLKYKYGLSVKLDKVPEQFQDLLGKNPVEVQFEGTLDMEVREISESGSAELVGTWKTAQAKGRVLLEEVDFAYDAAKGVPEKKDQAPDPGAQAFMGIQDGLARVVGEPLKLSVDRLGNVSVSEGGGKLGEMGGAFRSFNGLMGPLPQAAVGKGDAWKESLKLGMPGVGGQLEIPITVENAYDSRQPVGGRDCVMIRTKFVVGSKAGEKEVLEAAELGAKLTLEGGGEGKTAFSPKDGRAAESQSSLLGRLSIQLPDPAGGNELEIAGEFKIELKHELGGR